MRKGTIWYPQIEEFLVATIRAFNAKGISISRPDLLIFAQEEAKRTQIKFTGCLDWVHAVIIRHNFCTRKAATHVKVPDEKFNIVSTDFFQQIIDLVDKYGIPMDCVLNFDETPISQYPPHLTTITDRGAKKV